MGKEEGNYTKSASAEERKLRENFYAPILEVLQGVKPEDGKTADEIAKKIGVDRDDRFTYWALLGALDYLSRSALPNYPGQIPGRIGRRGDRERGAFVYFDHETSHNN